VKNLARAGPASVEKNFHFFEITSCRARGFADKTKNNPVSRRMKRRRTRANPQPPSMHMKRLLPALAAALIAPALMTHGQTAAPAVKVDAKKLKISAIETPQFQAGNVGEKRWRPKSWLEIDLEFDIRVPQSEGGRSGSLDSMTVNYYLAMNATTKDGKREVLKGSFNYVDIPAATTCHALAFASPATLRRVLQKDNFTAASDVQGWGYEILVGGQRVAGDSSLGSSPWWEKTDSLNINDGALLMKQETPFSILWGDYDVSAKKQ